MWLISFALGDVHPKLAKRRPNPEPDWVKLGEKMVISRRIACRMALIVATLTSSALGGRRQSHYEFTLPDRYIGWVQIIFNDPDAPYQQNRGDAYLIPVSEDGIFRTSGMRVLVMRPDDTFFYRVARPNGPLQLEPVPANYVMGGTDHGGFGLSKTGGRGMGSSWFFFIGPPEIRPKVPFADWEKEIESRKKIYGTADLGPPDPLPIPGRITPSAPTQR
jgi:hypothetical protein